MNEQELKQKEPITEAPPIKTYRPSATLYLPNGETFSLPVDAKPGGMTQAELDTAIEGLRTMVYNPNNTNLQLPLQDNCTIVMPGELLKKTYVIIDSGEVTSEF